MNMQNCRIWETQRPNEVYETIHNSPSDIPKNEVIGPYFFENENVTGSKYEKKQPYILFIRLQRYAEDMIFQQDGVPPHYF